MATEPFALEQVENPHPKMLTNALMYRRIARGAIGDVAENLWLGYRAAMADATGCTTTEIEAWLDRMEAS
jgi:hypothetical protein